jgi:serine phosphatase RsbU (regulator of sigma subunit)
VSGDFFWEKQVGHRYYFALCDSTGHGVPGSMVSLICSRALDEAIETYELTDPGAILAKSRELVIQSFTHSDKLINDGMDIGLCCLDKDMFLFSGARHSLYMLRGSGTIEEVKGTRQSIGYSMTNNPFTTHVLRKKSIRRVFLTTDGFFDQFGGSQNKKFKANRFKQLLNKTSQLPITKQKKVLQKIMHDWMQGYEQIDDMCVLGVDLQTTDW